MNTKQNGATMNCTECRENLVIYVEGLLDPETALRCRNHLEECAGCRSEHTAISRLQRQLLSKGCAADRVSIVDPVMRRIRAVPVEAERHTIMSIVMKHRWGFGFSATFAALVIIILILGNTSKIQASAVDVMAKGANVTSGITSIHIRGQLRTLPTDNFSYIDSKLDFVRVELWKQLSPELKWRVDKPGRFAVMDGQSTILFIQPDHAVKVGPSPSAFDTQWLQAMANPSGMLNYELRAAKLQGWPMTLDHKQGANGRPTSVITVDATASLPTDDYIKNKFFETSDTRREYIFDDQTGLLESARIYLKAESGERLIFELDQIDYNQPIDPAVFQPQLPANVAWEQEQQILPDNDRYAAMTPEEAARTFFEACSRDDWAEVGKFMTVSDSMKQYLGGIQVINIGNNFTSAISMINGDRFVPYEIKMKNGETKKWNLALRKDRSTNRWFIDGGI
jgi:hypothetical protein